MKAFHNFFQGYQASGSWIQITTSTGKSCNNKHVTAEWTFLCLVLKPACRDGETPQQARTIKKSCITHDQDLKIKK